jgi:hypothetical protein
MEQEHSEGRSNIVFASILLLGLISYIGYKYFALSNSKDTTAVYIGTKGSAWAKSRIITFKTEDGVTKKAELNTDVKIDVGDTIWIKYSIDYPNLVELIDTDYKKYIKNLPKE